MRFTFDPAKASANLAKHGVAFGAVADMDWSVAVVFADVRLAYPEPRLLALAPIGPRLHALVFSVERRAVRIISLRKASNREMARYEATV
jgi:uncharacterized DUF497 family protein